jgi:signal transduction histidine kinase
MRDGLTDPVVFGINEDHDGRIWFRTYSRKLCFYQNGRFHTYAFNHKITGVAPNAIIASLVNDRKNQLWLATPPVLIKIDSSGNVETSSVVPSGSMSIKNVDGTELITAYGPTQRINKLLRGRHEYVINQGDTTNCYHVVCASQWNNKLYFSLNDKIFALNGQIVECVLKASAPIISLRTDKENHLWVGYLNKGVERYSRNFAAPDLALFENLSITGVLQDGEGGIWMTSLQSGVFYIPNLTIKNLDTTHSRLVTAVASTADLIFTGDKNGVVRALNPNQGALLWEKEFSHPIRTLHASKNGQLLVATSQEVFMLDQKRRVINSFWTSRSCFAESDNEVWMLNGSLVMGVNAKGNVVHRYTHSSLYRKMVLSDSLLVLLTRSGIHVRDQHFNLLKTISLGENLKTNQLISLNDTLFLITTSENNLITIHKKTWQARPIEQAKFNGQIIYTTLVRDSALWLGTEKGIAVCNIVELLRGKATFNYLTHKSGLITDRINFLTPAKKQIWAISDAGISFIPDRHTQFANTAPVFLLTSIIVNNQPHADTGTIELSHRENYLQLEYASISFNNPDFLLRHRFSPRNNWVYSDARKLAFPSLAPDRYQFELEYSVDGAVWQKALRSPVIVILPPWWTRWYYQATAFVVLVVAGYWYVKYQRSIYRQKNEYLRIINEHQQKLLQSEVVTLERERNRIAKELHDRVGTNLTAIKLVVSQLLKTHKEPMADDIEEQFQVAVTEIKDIIYGLTPPSLERYGLFTGLKNYVGKLNKSIPIAIALKTFGNDVTKQDLSIIVFRVLQELLTNSIKHSFARNITIHINSFDDVLNIVYEDDGVGFSYDPLQSGLGLDSIESRIHSVNGTLKFDSGKFGISYTIDIPVTTNKEVA